MIVLLPLALALVVTGSVTSDTRVQTSVGSSNGKVETNITTTVNGKTTTVTSNAPGSVSVKVVNDQSSVIINGIPITPTTTVLATPTGIMRVSTSSGTQPASVPFRVFSRIRILLTQFFHSLLTRSF